MKKYIAYLDIGGFRTKIEFETDIRPVEYLWQKYGMSTFIESVEEIIEVKENREAK